MRDYLMKRMRVMNAVGERTYICMTGYLYIDKGDRRCETKIFTFCIYNALLIYGILAQIISLV